MTQSVGLAAVAHPQVMPDATHMHPYKKTVPSGQLAEIWYLATQKWIDPAKTQLRYCVYPRVEVTGSNTWTLPFNVKLLQGPGRVQVPGATLNVTGPFDAGQSRELTSSNVWCVQSAAAIRPPLLILDTDFGSAQVLFGPQPPR